MDQLGLRDLLDPQARTGLERSFDERSMVLVQARMFVALTPLTYASVAAEAVEQAAEQTLLLVKLL